MGQKVHKDILVTEPKAGAPAARRFRAIYDIPPGGGSTTPPYPDEGLRYVRRNNKCVVLVRGERCDILECRKSS